MERLPSLLQLKIKMDRLADMCKLKESDFYSYIFQNL